MSVQQAVTNAAREGCRTAVLATTTSANDVDTTVRNYLRSVVPDATNTQKVRINISPASFASLTSGTELTVNVELNYSDVSWFPTKSFHIDPVIAGVASQKRE